MVVKVKSEFFAAVFHHLRSPTCYCSYQESGFFEMLYYKAVFDIVLFILCAQVIVDDPSIGKHTINISDQDFDPFCFFKYLLGYVIQVILNYFFCFH